ICFIAPREGSGSSRHFRLDWYRDIRRRDIDFGKSYIPIGRPFKSGLIGHISSGQITDIYNYDLPDNIVILSYLDAPRLHGQIRALEDFGIARLIADANESNDPEANSRNRQSEREEGNRIARRLLPQRFALFILVSGLLSGLVTFLLLG